MEDQFIKEDLIRSCDDPSNLIGLKNCCVLITGGTGFIGRWILEMLNYFNSSHQFNIRIYLMARNEPVNFNYSNTYFIKSDIKNVKELPDEINFIINAAGSPDSREHLSNPLKTLEGIFKGTQNLLNIASRLPDLKKFIHFSSNKVYGMNYSNTPVSELNASFQNLDVNDIYSEAKRISESICRSYISEYNLPVVILRPFAFVGPYQSLEKPWALNSFIRDALFGGPIRIIGDEATSKSYLYGSDLANYVLSTLLYGKVGNAYNLGSVEAITLIDLANKIKNIIGDGIGIKINSSKDIYSKHIYDVPSMSKLETDIGLKPRITLDEALTRAIIWNKMHFNN
jgi:dTDP-glucose 4,6-dehydratase